MHAAWATARYSETINARARRGVVISQHVVGFAWRGVVRGACVAVKQTRAATCCAAWARACI